jgi:short-subunit dehydrogenase
MRIPAALLPVAGAAALTVGWRRRQQADDISGEVAVITGASRGLGLLLATELARRGCKLMICARDADEVQKAAARLHEAGAEVAAMACDVASEDAAQRLVDAARQHYGRLDIVISNAGTIRVGPVQSTTTADYEEALAVMALAPARLALAALPVMQEQGHGRIVTIASIGGKISVPHLLPYSTAKFAAVGFSEGLRAELGGGPVTVTTVVPGLMRTGSHVRAEFAGQREREFTWFALGASLPLVSMDAERAARQIVDGVAARRPEVLLTPAGQVAARLAGLAPGLTTAVLHTAGQVALPGPDGSGEATAGQGLRPAMPTAMFNVLTWLGRVASARFNELSRKPREERV